MDATEAHTPPTMGAHTTNATAEKSVRNVFPQNVLPLYRSIVARVFLGYSYTPIIFFSGAFMVIVCASPLIHGCFVEVAWDFHGICYGAFP